MRAIKKFLSRILRWRFYRALAFDWRFRPYRVCWDPDSRGIKSYEVSFDRDTPSYRVFSIPNARLQTDRSTYVAITVNNELVPGASLQKLGPKKRELPAEQSPSFGWGLINAAPLKVKGSVLSLLTGGWGNSNYHHWLTAVLPRISLAQSAGLASDVNYYLVPDDALHFQEETLNILGISNEMRLSSKKTPHISASAIIATTSTSSDVDNVPEWIVEWLRRVFLQKSTSQEHGELVYIGRADASKRRVLNEEECFSTVLEPLGFKYYKLSTLPFVSQVSLFAHADVIVAVHGASLANLTFCRNGAKVIELFSTRWQRRTFESISRLRGLDYQAIVGRDSPDGLRSPDPDFIVPLDELANKLLRIGR